MHRLQADLLLLLAAVLWGTAFYFQKTAMEHVGPILFVTARAVVATLALAPLVLLEARRAAWSWPRGLAGSAAAAGVAFFVAAILQQSGIVTASVTNAGFLTSLYVIVTPLLAWTVLHTPPTRYVWPAIALAFAGTWLLGGGTIGGFSPGDWLIALSAVVWAIHLLLTGASVRFARPIAFTAIQFCVLAACGLAAALLVEPITLDGLAGAAPAIAFVGIFSSAVTFTLLAVALKHTPPAEAAILVSMETLFAAAAGALLLGEQLAPIGWAGAALMFSATLLVQIGPYLSRVKEGNRPADG